MKKAAMAICGVFVFTLTVLAVTIAPDMLARGVVGVMVILMAAGAYAGVFCVGGLTRGLQTARKNIRKIMDLQPNAPWLYVQQNEQLFRQKELDGMLKGYITKAHRELQDGKVVSNIEDVINEESLQLRTWQGLVRMIPGTLTAIGLAGTFIGLIFGISSIAFSSVDSTIASIEVMLNGIRTAFYTSIAGIVFSILFNMISRIAWHNMLRELGLFTEEFHLYILPSTEEQTRQKQDQDMKKVLTLLERLPRVPRFSVSQDSVDKMSSEIRNEQQLLADIQEGLKNGEFVFHVQPKCDLHSKKVVGGEALMRWNHSKMGLVSPLAFLPVMERNGYIARIDRYIWESVCKEIRKWLDEGKKPLPLSINISKTDVLTMEVASFFTELTRKYRIPPKYIELEISTGAYLQCGETIRGVEKELRQSGFKVIVDGFNGDFTSMNMLKNAEVDGIKLDLRSMKYDEGTRNESIESVFEQAKALNIPMSAEGIESTEEVHMLRRIGFEEGQGYYLFRPMEMSEFKKLAE